MIRRLLVATLLLATPALGADPLLLTGKRLVLLGAGRNRAVELVSGDAGITLGRSNGSADDPVAHGGSVRVVSFTGGVFDATYGLPQRGWHYLGRKGGNAGYRFHGTGSVRSLLVKPGKLLRLTAKLSDPDHALSADPTPLQVVLTLGGQQYCLSFAGANASRRGKRWVASESAAPPVCPLAYADDSTWLCRPGMAQNQCFVNRLDATAVHADLSTALETHTGSEDRPYDCFYVYPTVDLTSTVGNHTDFSDLSLMLDPLLSQAARLNASCRIFAPLYRQITIATFGSPDRARYQDIAYGDVEDAFRRYLARDNGGRNFVIMGHSQGTFMVTRLIQNVVDGDPALRARLIVALLIGGSVVVPEGQLVGGSFHDIPLCTREGQTGCAIAYRSYAEGFPPAGGTNVQGPVGMDTACTNPAALAGGEGRFVKTYFPNRLHQPLFQIVPDPGFGTPFTLYADYYAGACVKDDRGRSYLQIRPRPGAGDQRPQPIPFGTAVVLSPSILGTHILDYNWAMGDLIRIVEKAAAAMP